MPGKVIAKSMTYGFLGSYARNGDCIISNRLRYDSDTGVLSFGDPVRLRSDNTFIKMQASAAATDFAGVVIREVKTPSTFNPAPTVGVVEVGEQVDVIQRGNVMVKCCVGTPAAGAAVYVRITANSGIAGATVGGFEYRTDDDSGKCVLLTTAKWATGLLDANRVAELCILTRQLP